MIYFNGPTVSIYSTLNNVNASHQGNPGTGPCRPWLLEWRPRKKPNTIYREQLRLKLLVIEPRRFFLKRFDQKYQFQLSSGRRLIPTPEAKDVDYYKSFYKPLTPEMIKKWKRGLVSQVRFFMYFLVFNFFLGNFSY